MRTIGVTGASGQLGSMVAENLMRKATPAHIVLTSRALTPLLQGFADRGASVRLADFSDRSTLVAAFDGIEDLLIISTDRVGDRLDGHLRAIGAARRAGVRRIVYTSVPQPISENPALVVPDHRATEEALEASGLEWAVLRNNLYADLQRTVIERAAATGRLISNSGAGAAAYVTRGDCAAVAASALTTRRDARGSYDVTGPEAVSAHGLAALAGDTVEVVDVDDAVFLDELTKAGMPDHVAALLTSFGAAIRGGYLATVTEVVENWTHRPPTPLSAVVQ
ncbi:NmrA family transcriptional regulator [Mycolicibacterium goodii]|uniref:NmrA family transcriptional regulator n=2 Tax=Mycolicibacterium goodii TaxID=134601 RepID=A0A0K0X0I0_MYCGD|nr:NmrA family transcriptional regulator [Mycolicibacterium goodii]